MQIPLESPGTVEDDGLVWSEADTAGPPVEHWEAWASGAMGEKTGKPGKWTKAINHG